MPLPVARTRDEAHLYMDLHPCEVCGSVDITWKSGLVDDGGELARRYSGTCPSCGTARQFVFTLPEKPLLPQPGEVVLFGADEPSQLMDAGEWMMVADRCARNAVIGRAADGSPTLDGTSRKNLAIALAAMDEVIKFVPDGSDEVPASGFWTTTGSLYRDGEPGRFRRDRLLVVRDSFQTTLRRAGT